MQAWQTNIKPGQFCYFPQETEIRAEGMLKGGTNREIVNKLEGLSCAIAFLSSSVSALLHEADPEGTEPVGAMWICERIQKEIEEIQGLCRG